jgi:Leucine-rich repeat (LRR) protein
VAELPVVVPDVVEYQLHRLTCPCCGISTCGTLPPGVKGHFGPRLEATLALLAGRYRLGLRPVAEMAADLWGLDISTGMVSKLRQRTAEALLLPWVQVALYVRRQNVNIDETSWRQGKESAYLWAAVPPLAALFRIAKGRTAQAAQAMLGTHYAGVATCDRLKSYWWIKRLQWCWAHLRRDFQAMIDRGGPGKAIGQALLRQSNRLFELWHQFRQGQLSRSRFQAAIKPLREAVRQTLQRGSRCRCRQTAGTCQELLGHEQWLWTFVDVEGVEPTNNEAERSERHGVLWRKTSGGTDSAQGSRFVERVVRVVETCRRRGQKVLDYLSTCLETWQHDREPRVWFPTPHDAPGLLPQFDSGNDGLFTGSSFTLRSCPSVVSLVIVNVTPTEEGFSIMARYRVLLGYIGEAVVANSVLLALLAGCSGRDRPPESSVPAGEDNTTPRPPDEGEQEQVVQAIKKLGGSVQQDANAPGQPVIGVRLSHTQVTDAGLKELAGLKQLRWLDLTGVKVTDAGLKELDGLTQLQALQLGSTQVTDAGLKELAGLKQLRTLHLHGLKVTDAGLKELDGLTELKSLDLSSTQVTDAGLKELAGLKQLWVLYLTSTPMTGVGLKELAGLKQLQTLQLGSPKVTDAGLKELAGLKQLQTLRLYFGTQVTDAGLKELARLKQLQALDLRDFQVTDAGLRELAGLKQLRSLELWNTQVTDAGLKELAGLTQLQALILVSTQVTDAGLKELAGLKQLQALRLYGTQVTDAGLKELAGLTQLQMLDLSSTKVTDAGLKELAGLKQLRTLYLTGTKVTDAGLKEVAGFTQLQTLDLNSTQVTDAGLKELKAALPQCYIRK